MISGRLYIGGRIRKFDWNFIYSHISAIINLQLKQDQPPFDFSHRIMIWAPLTLSSPPSLQWIMDMTNLISNLIDSGYSVLLHDTAGIQRLGFVITAFYMQRFSLGRDQALSVIRQRKPDINPPENYMNLLAQFEVYLQRP